LLSDSGTDYDLLMRRDMPKQCFNFGISEQHKIAAASGMAAMGKIPFVYTTGAFIAYRAHEFVRDDICFQKRNVKLMGMGMGMSMGSWSTLGASHHTTEDIAALRALPNLTLMCAATPIEVRKTVQAAYEIDGPVYVRLGMSNEDELYDEDYDFQVGKLSAVISGGDQTVFVTGTVAGEAYKSVTRLNEEGYSVSLINVSTLKPLDAAGILSCVKKKVFTVEEHNILGGLGGAIAEVLAEHVFSVPLIRIGLRDCFAEGYGTTNEVRAMNGLDAYGIYKQIKKHLQTEEGNPK
jgi:transketolase